ncbi:MAG: cellulose biosynthesis cyclic di-GMP-binding regulatory protein BcsB [Anaerolineae bacterium]|nr:cellulose biosynthesis cyclic di-GMP-binding regulatory protein BcsB [Anaerolineae bacterium]
MALPILVAAVGLFPEVCQAQEVGIPAPVVSLTYQTTFEALGYSEYILESPVAQQEYAFRLPEGWLVNGGSYLDLEFSYFFTELEQKEGVELRGFGQLSVSMDGSQLAVYTLDAATLERQRLRVNLPPNLLNDQPGKRHEVVVALNAWFLCDTVHVGELIVHPESTLFFNYTLNPFVLDLADYPRPFSQNAFDLDYVRFILPAQPSEAEIRTAATIAAGLGDLAGSNMVISVTTDVDWLRLVEAGQAGGDHLFVIGSPDRNQLIPKLSDNEAISLPISMYQRTLSLHTQGPQIVGPGDIFTYVISITNTTSALAQDFTLIDDLPLLTDWVSCDPECTEVDEESLSDRVFWSLSPLAPGEHTVFSVTLQLREIQHLSSTLSLLENMVVLAGETQKPVNISSLSTRVGDELGKELVGSPVQSNYFFTREGSPVPEGDGVLQEILSPWDPQKVMLIITGLSDDAVHKAAQALGLDTGLLDMEGPDELIREIRPSPPVTETWMSDFTLADLGYGDRIEYGIYPRSPKVDYWFDIPGSWYYTNASYLYLHFVYSGMIDVQNSSLTILLNNSPLSTISLTQTNTTEHSLLLNIPATDLKPGANNKLSVQSFIRLENGDECRNFDLTQAWLKVFQDSRLHFEMRQEKRVTELALEHFPSPFDDMPDLGDLLFVLPSNPTAIEVEALLRIASRLGRSTNVEKINSRVSLGRPADALLQNYHIIVMGRPTRNPLIQEINASLPQPFISATDEVENWMGEVLLRLPSHIPLGYVQELQSPWNEELSFLVVTGTQDEAVAWAAYMLGSQSWRFKGNLALVREGTTGMEVHTFDTRRLSNSGQTAALLTVVSELTLTLTATATPTVALTLENAINVTPTLIASTTNDNPPEPAGIAGLPVWVIGFIGFTGVVIVAMFAIVIWRFQRRKVK